ncbi:MAG: hypothetical protein WCO44_12960 [Bacteroidota bacterium]
MNNGFNRLVFIIAITWYSLTAWYSLGYYHADEHYQVVEFSGIKVGTNVASDLAWEYQARIRPALQPAVCFAIFSACRMFNLEDPYAKAFLLRLITGFFALILINYFVKSCSQLVSAKNRRLFFILSFFTWFLPFLNVRFSSETWSGLLLLPVVAIALKEHISWQKHGLIGLLLGLSFLFRFQSGIVAISVFLWMIAVKRVPAARLMVMLAGFLLMVAGGTLVDSWFYGSWVFTPWRYFKVNFLEGVADTFGTAPWYYYFYYVFRFAFFPFGIIIILSFFILVLKKPASLLVWVILPFVVIHSCIPHKELRFLFPLVNLVPLMVFLAFQELPVNLRRGNILKMAYVLLVALFLVNVAALATASLKPADIGRIRITRLIHGIADPGRYLLITFGGSNPYQPWGLLARFYREPHLSSVNLPVSGERDTSETGSKKHMLLVVSKKDVQNPEIQATIARCGLSIAEQSIPALFEPFLTIYGGFPMDDILLLYRETGISR